MLAEWCEKEGRDPAAIERSCGVPAGDPATAGPALAAEGIRLFTVGEGGPTYDLGRLRDWVAWRDEQNASASVATTTG